MIDAAFVTGGLHIKEKQHTIMIEEYIEELTDKQRQLCERLAEELYEALRNTIAHLYGKKFLFELETNVSGIIRRSRYNDTIPDRLSLLRKQYRTKYKIIIPYRIMGKAYYHSVYEPFNKIHKHFDEKHALNQIRKRSKARQRYNRLVEVIRRDLGEEVQKELIWRAEVRALAEIMNKYQYCNSSWIKGYCENDRACALRHLRILYAYQRERHQDMYGTRIHNQINANYRSGMLDYYKNE